MKIIFNIKINSGVGFLKTFQFGELLVIAFNIFLILK